MISDNLADKEQWEATLGHIFAIQDRKSEFHRVREAWALDWQSHGDSAVLNAVVLDESDECVCMSAFLFFFMWMLIMVCLAASERAVALSWFLRSDHVKGHRLVGLGHSAGSAAMYVYSFLRRGCTHFRLAFCRRDRSSKLPFPIKLSSSSNPPWPPEKRTHFDSRSGKQK